MLVLWRQVAMTARKTVKPKIGQSHRPRVAETAPSVTGSERAAKMEPTET